MWMESCLEDAVNKNVVVRIDSINVHGRLVDYELGAVIVLEQGNGRCIVKDWYAIIIEDLAQSLRASYQPPNHKAGHNDFRRNTTSGDVDAARQKFFKHHPHYTRRRKPH